MALQLITTKARSFSSIGYLILLLHPPKKKGLSIMIPHSMVGYLDGAQYRMITRLKMLHQIQRQERRNLISHNAKPKLIISKNIKAKSP